MRPEERLQYEIRRDLGLEPDLELMRNDVAMVDDLRAGRMRRIGLGVGTPDLVGILAPHGRLFALEVKTPSGRVSHEQRLCHERWRRLGAFVAVVRSVEQARDALQRARDGAYE